MKKRIPTYEDCKAIVKSKGDLVFYETIHSINGCQISLFNYRLPSYTDFLNDEIDYREMRGLCFVFNQDGSLNERYLMLHKFFNLNQVEESMYFKVKDKKIKSIYDKLDGSLVSFIKVKDKIVPKTKMGFDNDQINEVNVLYNSNKNIEKFLIDCFKKDLVTTWEYVSFKNKIVLNYKNSNLVLLRVRNNKTGEYVDVEQFRGLGFDVAESKVFSNLDSIIEWTKTTKDVEGCVVTFEDDSMIKVKTQWYCDLHHLVDSINREDYIIEMILKETIDDLKAQLNPVFDVERIAWIENIEVMVRNFLVERVAEVEELVSKYNGDLKYFAIAYKKDKNFSLAINVVRGKCDAYTAVKEWLLVQTKYLEQARSFINNKGFKRK